jgi:CBS domain-containing protein
MSRDVIALRAGQAVGEVRDWIRAGSGGSTHQGFPVLDDDGRVVGIVTRRELFAPELGESVPVREAVRRAPVVVFPRNTVREAADQMVRADVGRLPVLDPGTTRLLGIVSRSDLLSAHARRLHATTTRERGVR